MADFINYKLIGFVKSGQVQTRVKSGGSRGSKLQDKHFDKRSFQFNNITDESFTTSRN